MKYVLNGDGMILRSKIGAGGLFMVAPNFSLNYTCLYFDYGLLMASVEELAGLS